MIPRPFCRLSLNVLLKPMKGIGIKQKGKFAEDVKHKKAA